MIALKMTGIRLSLMHEIKMKLTETKLKQAEERDKRFGCNVAVKPSCIQ